MKALILAAGFGTRLKPYTRHTPKPLFPINGRPLLAWTIRRLIRAGVSEIAVNTHHLAEQIERYIRSQSYPIPVLTRREPVILGTGGAIRNLADFWDDTPFFVINGDILTDVDFKKVYDFHQNHTHPVTLVLCDDPEVNTVSVISDQIPGDQIVGGFTPNENLIREKQDHHLDQRLTFTGIQVMDSDVVNRIPAEGYYHSIDLFRNIMKDGQTLSAYVPKRIFWQDLGTPERYRKAALNALVEKAFPDESQRKNRTNCNTVKLQGDGSDRKWYRLEKNGGTMILADHGIREGLGQTEADAFVDIGRHLEKQHVAVPKILAADRFAGLVMVEDLGDENLQDRMKKETEPQSVISMYRTVVDRLIVLHGTGDEGFDPSWACQTPIYDMPFIVEYECRYFMREFIAGYLGKSPDAGSLSPEFSRLAGRTVLNGLAGFMHRDCQSRNIMIHQGRPYFIDFQGGRIGPLQYDLASLLIDPYVNLPVDVQDRLFEYAVSRLAETRCINESSFRKGHRYARVCRNLQILGAFGFLTKQKNKHWFETYIPTAVRSLKRNITALPVSDFPRLRTLVTGL